MHIKCLRIIQSTKVSDSQNYGKGIMRQTSNYHEKFMRKSFKMHTYIYICIDTHTHIYIYIYLLIILSFFAVVYTILYFDHLRIIHCANITYFNVKDLNFDFIHMRICFKNFTP